MVLPIWSYYHHDMWSQGQGVSFSIRHQNSPGDFEVSSIDKTILLVGDLLTGGLLNLRKLMSNYVAVHRKHPSFLSYMDNMYIQWKLEAFYIQIWHKKIELVIKKFAKISFPKFSSHFWPNFFSKLEFFKKFIGKLEFRKKMQSKMRWKFWKFFYANIFINSIFYVKFECRMFPAFI